MNRVLFAIFHMCNDFDAFNDFVLRNVEELGLVHVNNQYFAGASEFDPHFVVFHSKLKKRPASNPSTARVASATSATVPLAECAPFKISVSIIRLALTMRTMLMLLILMSVGPLDDMRTNPLTDEVGIGDVGILNMSSCA